jgi:NAD(P)H-binding
LISHSWLSSSKASNRLVAVTGLGAGDSRGHGGLLYDGVVLPLLLKRVYDDKDVQEWIIRSSGLDWTIVRPSLLTSGPAAGRYRVLSVPQETRPFAKGSTSLLDAQDVIAPIVQLGAFDHTREAGKLLLPVLHTA